MPGIPVRTLRARSLKILTRPGKASGIACRCAVERRSREANQASLRQLRRAGGYIVSGNRIGEKSEWINSIHSERVVRGGKERKVSGHGKIIGQLQYVEASAHRLARSVLKALKHRGVFPVSRKGKGGQDRIRKAGMSLPAKSMNSLPKFRRFKKMKKFVSITCFLFLMLVVGYGSASAQPGPAGGPGRGYCWRAMQSSGTTLTGWRCPRGLNCPGPRGGRYGNGARYGRGAGWGGNQGYYTGK